jgi:hypothetical protein
MEKHMEKHMKVVTLLYGILSVIAIVNILIWGGYLKINWMPNTSTLSTLEQVGLIITILLTVYWGHKYVKKPQAGLKL